MTDFVGPDQDLSEPGDFDPWDKPAPARGDGSAFRAMFTKKGKPRHALFAERKPAKAERAVSDAFWRGYQAGLEMGRAYPTDA